MKFLQRTTRALLQIGEDPKRTALSFSIGVFFGFSPFLGLHTVLGLGTALLFRLNKVAMLIGVYANNPWIVVPFYGAATWLGIQVTGLPEGLSLPSVGFLEIFTLQFWEWLLSQWRVLIPAFVGSTILCTLLALLAYPSCLWFLRKFAARRAVSGGDTGGQLEGVEDGQAV